MNTHALSHAARHRLPHLPRFVAGIHSPGALLLAVLGALAPATGGLFAAIDAESRTIPVLSGGGGGNEVRPIDLELLREINAVRRDLYITATAAGLTGAGVGVVVDRRRRKAGVS